MSGGVAPHPKPKGLRKQERKEIKMELTEAKVEEIKAEVSDKTATAFREAILSGIKGTDFKVSEDTIDYRFNYAMDNLIDQVLRQQ